MAHEVTVLTHRKQFIRVGCLPGITHILLSWTVSVVFINQKLFVRVNHMPYITHTLMWLTVYVALPNSKWFIGASCMPYIAHTLIWLPVSVVLPHRRQFEWINPVSCIAHATKIWTVFDGSAIANVLHLFWRFLHHHLRLLHHTQFRQRVSDRSVVLAVSCSSEGWARTPGNFTTMRVVLVVYRTPREIMC